MTNQPSSSAALTPGKAHFATAAKSSVAPAAATAVLELRVRNHPGTMSHITGLFARRAFNLEAIACCPVGDGSTSTVLLLVADEPRLEQVERQLEKLHDVLSVRHRSDLLPAFFARCVGAE
jgi:acetolactate synthase-1/3 small subunit